MQSRSRFPARQWLLALMLLGLACLIASCAVSPQTVAIRPELKVPSMPIGHGRPVAVQTRDQRSDTTMGTLGGIYQSAYISTDDRLEQSISQAAVAVLQSWDFVAVPAHLSRADGANFTIEILELKYQRPTTTVGGTVVVKCRVAVRVDQGNESYQGEYRSQRSEQVAVMGTTAGNRRVVNETVNQVLNAAFLDSKLQRFMAR